MSDAALLVKDLSTGQERPLAPNDVPTDSGGNPKLNIRLATVTGIDLKTIATTVLYTVPVGLKAVILAVVLEITTGASITADAKAGVGIAAGEDDIFASETLVNTRATDNIWMFSAKGRARTALASSVVKLGIDTGATGTTLIATAHVLGYTF